jgi:hypothetical protein
MSKTERTVPSEDDRSPSRFLSRVLPLLRRPAARHVGAFLLFQGFWLAWMGPRLLMGGPHHLRILSSLSSEASVFAWSLEWWARAVTHASNPLISGAVWAPTGMNLAWVTTIPGPALILAPLTRAAGSTASFNTLALLTPPLTAWTAYLLAHRVTRRTLPAMVGGFLFGFSPLVMREIQQGHLNLSMLFLLPLAAYLILRRVEGTMGRVSFVLLLAAVLIGQFSIFIEIFATATLLGVLIGATAWLFAPPTIRKRLQETGVLVVFAYLVVAALVSPFLYTAFAHQNVAKPAQFGGLAAGVRGPRDLKFFVEPSRAMVIGPPLQQRKADTNFWYFGLPLLLLLAIFWVQGRRDWKVRTLALGFVLSVILALGQELPVGGRVIPLPWTVFGHLPLLERARPGRLVAFAFLISSLSVAIWISQVRGRSKRSLIRWGLAFLVVVSIIPKYWADLWTTDVPMPAFFSVGEYRNYLCPGEIALTVNPRGNRQVYWQVQAHMYFRNVTWYQGFVPANYVDTHFALRLTRGRLRPTDGAKLKGFVARHNVTAVVADGVSGVFVERFTSALGVTQQAIDGVKFFRLAPCPSG